MKNGNPLGDLIPFLSGPSQPLQLQSVGKLQKARISVSMWMMEHLISTLIIPKIWTSIGNLLHKFNPRDLNNIFFWAKVDLFLCSGICKPIFPRFWKLLQISRNLETYFIEKEITWWPQASIESAASTSKFWEILLAARTMMKKSCNSISDIFEGCYIVFIARVRAVEVPCVLNIAAVKLKFKEYDEAIYECNKVLEIEVRYCIVKLPAFQLFALAFLLWSFAEINPLCVTVKRWDKRFRAIGLHDTLVPYVWATQDWENWKLSNICLNIL